MPDNRLALVTGRFDLGKRYAHIDFVTPVALPSVPERSANEQSPLALRGIADNGDTQFQQPVKLLRNSCMPKADYGTFQEYVPTVASLARIQLLYDGEKMHEVDRAGHARPGPDTFVFGMPDPTKTNKLSLEATAPVADGATFTIQARPEGTTRWFTLAVGKKDPKAEVDLNQFPGASSVDVRVLRSDGFSESEVFSESRKVD
jgi:hypothetical protein